MAKLKEEDLMCALDVKLLFVKLGPYYLLKQ